MCRHINIYTMLDLQAIACEFDSHLVTNISGLVSQLI